MIHHQYLAKSLIFNNKKIAIFALSFIREKLENRGIDKK